MCGGVQREVCEGARAASEKDRDVLEKGTRAFMSCVRAYKEHQCNFIFRMAKLVRGNVSSLLLRSERRTFVRRLLCAGPTLRPCDNTRLRVSSLPALLPDDTISKGPLLRTARNVVPPLSLVRPSALRMPISCIQG